MWSAFMAFGESHNATYDSAPWDRLLCNLWGYAARIKLIKLLVDLDSGTHAAVAVGGVAYEWFDHGGVRQGGAITALLLDT